MLDKCSICEDKTPTKLLGWFGECPNCRFKMDFFDMSPEDIKRQAQEKLNMLSEIPDDGDEDED